MSLLAFGINHKTAPVDIRERVAFAPGNLIDALKDLVTNARIQEAAIVSTCNRTELYCDSGQHTGQGQCDNAVIVDWFREYHKLEKRDIEPYIFLHPDQEAVRHMLRVASGLDSLVLGEPQILGQIKDAYATATEAGTMGGQLDRLFQHTFSVAKQVRTDTAIGASAVSVAFAAVSLSKQIFDAFDKRTALLIGAGETVELAARHLHQSGIGRMIIANRTVENAHTLAQEVGAYAISLPEITQHLAEADIVISSTASPLPILGKGSVESALKKRKHRPMLMVDIAVPRDIEPEVSDLNDVYLYTVDDLQDIIQEGLRSRQEAAQQAEEIIDTEVSHFMHWLRSLDAVSTIRAMREDAQSQRDIELERAMRLLQSGKDAEQVITEMANRLTNKLIHTPSVQLKKAGYDARKEIFDTARELYDLKDRDL
ncbi:MAG: glutamyl-tRNA reductase [Gammaproteobacteria bacterium]|nr:glutamyl-tRNA reductase [Gammaproteobacteria bacterium]MCF6259886.1 glutamyl-tRNA reductase [Gammaproteobacteria bacterium]